MKNMERYFYVTKVNVVWNISRLVIKAVSSLFPLVPNDSLRLNDCDGFSFDEAVAACVR